MRFLSRLLGRTDPAASARDKTERYDALVERARSIAGGGDFRGAEAVFKEAIALDPGREEAQQGLVVVVQRRVQAGDVDQPAPEPELTGALPFFSIVICSIDAKKYETVTAMYRALLADVPHELIGIHDARSLCEGYNRGIRSSKGDVIVFSHDDVEILEPAFARRLARHMAAHDLVGVCGTSLLTDGDYWPSAGWPHLRGLVAHHYRDTDRYRVMVLDGGTDPSIDVQALDGLFFAARRSLVERLPFDEETFDGFHLYDLDYSFSAYLEGYDVAVCRDIPIIHYTYAEGAGYEQTHAKYLERFRRKHQGRFTTVERGNTLFFAALFDEKAQVKAFCDALLASRRTIAASI